MKTIMSGKVISFPNGGRQVVTSAIERTPEDATILKTIATELARHPKGEKKLTEAQLDREIDAIVDATGEILKRKNARERRAAEFKRQRQERMIEQMRSAARETVNGVQLGWCMFWAIIYGGIDLFKRMPGALAIKATPELEGLLVPMCDYCGGVCHEMQPCGKRGKAQ